MTEAVPSVSRIIPPSQDIAETFHCRMNGQVTPGGLFGCTEHTLCLSRGWKYPMCLFRRSHLIFLSMLFLSDSAYLRGAWSAKCVGQYFSTRLWGRIYTARVGSLGQALLTPSRALRETSASALAQALAKPLFSCLPAMVPTSIFEPGPDG